MKIFDTHSHYDDTAFDGERDELIERMLSEYVAGFNAMGCSLESSRAAIALAERYNSVFAAVGVHPENLEGLEEDYIERLKALSTHEKVCAIGEIGLDYHYEGFDREKQLEIFERQLKLAQEVELPVIIHSRDATADCMAILNRYKPRGVMHCFSGSRETAREVVALGMYVGFTGVVTFKNSRRAVEAAADVPLERLLLETDCPYMAPVPNRGQRCDSSMLTFTAQKIAEIRGIETQTLINACNENAKELFGIEFLA